MRSRITLGFLLPVAFAVLAAPPPATSAGETCQGQPATIVGGPAQPTITGTDGPDVIVTAGSTTVNALGGDDLICVTGAADRVRTYLGPGADSYVGGPGRDIVTSPSSTGDPEDSGPDDVSTGDGRDLFVAGSPVGAVDLGDGADRVVILAGGSSATVSTGPGRDTISLHGSADGAAAYDAGPGRDRLELVQASATMVDLRREVLGVGAAEVSLRGIQDVRVQGEEAFFVVGDGLDNRIEVSACRSVVRGGRGDDTFVSFAATGGSACLEGSVVGDQFFGNQGNDRAHGSNGSGDRFGGGPGDDVLKSARGPNRLTGGGGNDRLIGGAGRDTILGGKGQDTMRGNAGADRLFGNRGRDVADGDAGFDRCRAEFTATCER